MAEHLTLLGGAQYLGWARSRIKALRGAGLRFARKVYILADAAVTVRISEDEDYIDIEGGADLWLLVTSANVPALDPHPTTFPDTHNTVLERHTKLFRLRPPYAPAAAELIYEGSTIQTTAVTYDQDPTHSFALYVPSVTNSFALTGAHGAVSGFIPQKGAALMFFNQEEWNETSDNATPHLYHFTQALRTKMVWRDQSYTYEATHTIDRENDPTGAVISETEVFDGQIPISPPASMKNGEANYKALNPGNTLFAVGSGTTEFHRIVLEDNTPTTDPEGVAPAAQPLSERLEDPYSRREVGGVDQSKTRIFSYKDESATTHDAKFNREYTRVSDTPFDAGLGATGTIFMDDVRLLGPLDGHPATLGLSILNYDGTELKALDLTELPGLSDDAAFADYFADLDDAQWGYDTAFASYGYWSTAPSAHNISNFTTWPVTEARPSISWLFPSTGAATRILNVQPMLDQTALWN